MALRKLDVLNAARDLSDLRSPRGNRLDPGFFNWVDTGGVHEGALFVRRQSVPEKSLDGIGALRDVKVVKLKQLVETLPSDAPKITSAERSRQLRVRAPAYGRRFGSSPP